MEDFHVNVVKLIKLLILVLAFFIKNSSLPLSNKIYFFVFSLKCSIAMFFIFRN